MPNLTNQLLFALFHSYRVQNELNFRESLKLPKPNFSGVDAVVALCEYLQERPDITSLELDVGEASAIVLAGNKTLTHLDVSYNKLGEEAAKALATHQTLTHLDVSDNRLGDEGATILSKNSTLTNLDVSNNRIGDEGAIILADNQTLTTLRVEENEIEDQSAAAFLTNHTLLNLYIDAPSDASLEEDIRHLGEKNREFQKNYTQAVGHFLTKALGVKDLVKLVQNYTVGEFPNRGLFFTPAPQADTPTNAMQEELEKRTNTTESPTKKPCL